MKADDQQIGFCRRCGKGLVLAGSQWVTDEKDTLGQYCWVDPAGGSELHQPEPYFKSDELTQIREAITEYYGALDRREHGGAAESRAFSKIQDILGMSWVQGATLKEKQR